MSSAENAAASSSASLGYHALASVDRMPLSEVLREKAALKAGLASASAAFEAGAGRPLERAEREALRPLYLRYWKLRRAARRSTRRAAEAADASAAAVAGAGGGEAMAVE